MPVIGCVRVCSPASGVFGGGLQLNFPCVIQPKQLHLLSNLAVLHRLPLSTSIRSRNLSSSHNPASMHSEAIPDASWLLRGSELSKFTLHSILASRL